MAGGSCACDNTEENPCSTTRKCRDPCCKNMYHEYLDRFDREFSVICETLKDELENQKRVPCVKCCPPKFLNRLSGGPSCCSKSQTAAGPLLSCVKQSLSQLFFGSQESACTHRSARSQSACCRNMYSVFNSCFERTFGDLCETLWRELDNQKRVPCVNCCAPRFLNRLQYPSLCPSLCRRRF